MSDNVRMRSNDSVGSSPPQIRQWNPPVKVYHVRNALKDPDYEDISDMLHRTIHAQTVTIHELKGEAAALKRQIVDVVQKMDKPRLENDLAAINYRSAVRE